MSSVIASEHTLRVSDAAQSKTTPCPLSRARACVCVCACACGDNKSIELPSRAVAACHRRTNCLALARAHLQDSSKWGLLPLQVTLMTQMHSANWAPFFFFCSTDDLKKKKKKKSSSVLMASQNTLFPETPRARVHAAIKFHQA